MPTDSHDYQNSAGRLLSLLSSAKVGQSHLDVYCGILDESFLNSPFGRQRHCFSALFQIGILYEQFQKDMRDVEIDTRQRDVLLSGVATIEDCIYPLQLNSAYRGLTDAEKALLEVCATILQQEGDITSEDLEAIRKSIASLRKLIEEGGISPTLRKSLLELMRLSEDAISRFNIHGAQGLKRAYKQMLGESAELYAASEKKDPETWSTVVTHLKTIDGILSRILKYKPLIDHATQFLIGSQTA